MTTRTFGSRIWREWNCSREMDHNGDCCPLGFVVIDGCGVPADLYQLVKDKAVESGRTHFIGVEYRPPDREQRDHVADVSTEVLQVLAAMFQPQTDLLVGRHCTFTLYASREEVPADCLMVLWITPRAVDANR